MVTMISSLTVTEISDAGTVAKQDQGMGGGSEALKPQRSAYIDA